jgi:hypothetical protein
MSRIHQKRDGSSVYKRLKADAKESRTQKHQEWMDRKLGRNRQTSDAYASSPAAADPAAQMWAEAAKTLGMTAQSDGQGGVVFSDPADSNPLHLKVDDDGIYRWQYPQEPAPQPAAEGDMQLLPDEHGVLRWILPGEQAPAGPATSSPGSDDLWKQAGEMLGMTVESNGSGGYIFKDR